MSVTRLITPDDAPALTRLVRANREFLAPWDPVRGADYFTEAGQRADILGSLTQYAQGVRVPHLILRESGGIAGRITLNTVVRGAFQSASVGYWVGAADNGRGLATAAVRVMIQLAFHDLGLHRLEAGTLVHNVRSQRVLEHNGFVRFGLAPEYLNIAGRWQDHVLYQLINSRPG
ncbi:MAG TPA: GNAT family protein [Streptosporangiaceae bacterium]|nr:GNAT family protein [Streptosporangiaceae bacterium]